MNQPAAPDIYTEPWIYWLQAAAEHVQRAKDCYATAMSGLPVGPDLLRATLGELPAAMQAIAASAFALDGFEKAMGDLVQLPHEGGPRPLTIVRNLSAICALSAAEQARFEEEVRWLFDARNEAVHSGVWKNSAWRHPNGLSVSAVQRDIDAKSAERALRVCRELLGACLGASYTESALSDWARLRRARCQDLL